MTDKDLIYNNVQLVYGGPQNRSYWQISGEIGRQTYPAICTRVEAVNEYWKSTVLKRFGLPVDSFGSDLPDNWEDIIKDFDSCLREAASAFQNITEIREFTEHLWEKICSVESTDISDRFEIVSDILEKHCNEPVTVYRVYKETDITAMSKTAPLWWTEAELRDAYGKRLNDYPELLAEFYTESVAREFFEKEKTFCSSSSSSLWRSSFDYLELTKEVFSNRHDYYYDGGFSDEIDTVADYIAPVPCDYYGLSRRYDEDEYTSVVHLTTEDEGAQWEQQMIDECRDYDIESERERAVDEVGEDAVRRAEEKAEKKETAAVRKKPARSR